MHLENRCAYVTHQYNKVGTNILSPDKCMKKLVTSKCLSNTKSKLNRCESLKGKIEHCSILFRSVGTYVNQNLLGKNPVDNLFLKLAMGSE